MIAVTGLARLAGELSAPEQLWSTGYGNDLLLKTALLCPVLLVARRSRRVAAALAAGWTPTAVRLRAVIGRTESGHTCGAPTYDGRISSTS